MKKLLTLLAMCLALFSLNSVQGQNLTLSALFVDGAIENVAPDAWARVGYQVGLIEPFVGVSDDIDSYEVGFKFYSDDLTEQDALPFLSAFLSEYLSENMVLKGYTGVHRIEGEDTEDYTGLLIGLEQFEKDSPIALAAEAQFNDDNRIYYYLGLVLKF